MLGFLIFLLLCGVIIAVVGLFIIGCMEESNLTPEQRERREEERHYRRMLAAEEEHLRRLGEQKLEMQKQSQRSAIGSTVAKTAAAIALHAMFGSNGRHRH